VSINAVDGSLDQLFLEMRKSLDVVLSALNLDLRLTGDNTETCARGIKKATIKLLENVRKLATIIVNYDCVIDS